MDLESREPPPRSTPSQESAQDQEHHHPVPPGLVRLYGLIAVLLVLLPEWMADLRQMSRNVRLQAHPTPPDLAQAPARAPAARRQPNRRAPWLLHGARAALFVGVGASLGWGAGQLKPLPQLSLPPLVNPPAGQSPLAGVPPGQLLLQSSGPSWVEVRSLGGKSLYSAILQGQVQLPVGQGIKVLAGRPDLVRVSGAGQSPKALGTIDRIEWVAFPQR